MWYKLVSGSVFQYHTCIVGFIFLFHHPDNQSLINLQNEPTNEKSLKQLSKPLRNQQASEFKSSRKRTENLHREGDENRSPSPSLPQLPHSASPSLPPHLPSPSPAPLSAEERATDEETLDARETLFAEGEEGIKYKCCMQ